MKINPDFEMREVCGEKILVATGLENINYNQLISFNETGAFLYETAAALPTFEEAQLVEALTQEYDVDTETARRDVHTTVQQWQEAGLLL